jgi:cytochrome P450
MELAADPDQRGADFGSARQSPRGVWRLTRYDDICSVLRDQDFGRAGFLELIAPESREALAPGLSMRFHDPPAHTRLRNLVGKALTRARVRALRPLIQRTVEELLDVGRNAGGMDLIAGLGLTLSLRVILEFLGVPATDHGQFREWSRTVTQSMDTAVGPDGTARAAAAQRAMAEYFRDLIGHRRSSPGNDMLAGLMAAEHEGDQLTELEIVDLCVLLFVAGHTTTIDLIGNGVLNLLLHPWELRRLREEPRLIAQAVEELLRYESPVQHVGRIAIREVEIRGARLPKGAMVSVMLGAANRDPAQYDGPERLDIGRRGNHLAFGYGARACIGASLARLEGQIAIGTFVSRFPAVALVDRTQQWRNSTQTRGLRELRVTF